MKRNNPFKSEFVHLKSIKKEPHDNVTYGFECNPSFTFMPGQFNMVNIPGVGEAPISISSEPFSDGYFEHTVRDVGRVTGAMARLTKGDSVYIRGPYGRGWPVEEAAGKDLLIVAGGIGLAPLRPFIKYALNNRSFYGKIVLLYGARTPLDMLYTDEIKKWREEENIAIMLTVDDLPEGVEWPYDMGVVTMLFDEIDLPPHRTVVLTCGPEIMMRFVVRGLLIRRYIGSKIYISLERRMKCGISMCGHCQIGSKFVCKDGPVFSYPEIEELPDTLF